MSQETKREFSVAVGHHALQGYRAYMEDEFIIEHFTVSRHGGSFSLYGVFDGHGGVKAAKYVKDNIRRVLVDLLHAGPDVGEALKKCYLQLDQEFLAQPTRDNSGTTAVCMLLHWESKKLWVANTGDSRCILSTKDTVLPLSVDHKPERPDEHERIRKAGGFVIHNRVMGGLAVSRAIGDCDFKSDGLNLVIAEPEVTERSISHEDAHIVLACDGLYDVMQNDAICRFVRREFKAGRNPEQAAAAIASHAVKNLHSQDNVSVVIVRFLHPEGPSSEGAGTAAKATLSKPLTSVATEAVDTNEESPDEASSSPALEAAPSYPLSPSDSDSSFDVSFTYAASPPLKEGPTGHAFL